MSDFSYVCDRCHKKLGSGVSVPLDNPPQGECVLCGEPASYVYPQSPTFLRSMAAAAQALADEAGVDVVTPFE